MGPAVPLFTQALQSKTEQELLRILQQSKFQQGTGPIVAAEQGEEEEVEEDPAEVGACVALLRAVSTACVRHDSPLQFAAGRRKGHVRNWMQLILPILSFPLQFVNPQTGEKYGPKGKEPTRHGGCVRRLQSSSQYNGTSNRLFCASLCFFGCSHAMSH